MVTAIIVIGVLASALTWFAVTDFSGNKRHRNEGRDEH